MAFGATGTSAASVLQVVILTTLATRWIGVATYDCAVYEDLGCWALNGTGPDTADVVGFEFPYDFYPIPVNSRTCYDARFCAMSCLQLNATYVYSATHILPLSATSAQTRCRCGPALNSTAIQVSDSHCNLTCELHVHVCIILLYTPLAAVAMIDFVA